MKSPKLLLLFCIAILSHQAVAEEGVLIDLETAWQRVVTNSPSLAAVDQEICIQEGEKRQVSTILNPLAVVEAENLGVHPTRNNTAEPPQVTYSLSQIVELGGKRGARRAFASSFISIANLDVQIERQNLRKELTLAFIDISVAQEHLKLAKESERIACKVLEAAGKQVDSGKFSPLLKRKAQISLMSAQLNVMEALSDLEQAKKRLSSMWGSPSSDFDGVIFKIFDNLAPPCQTCVVDGLFQNPEFAKAKLAILSASKNLQLQKANRLPDVTVTVGYRTFNDSGQHGWVVGAGLPLAFFNRNQGNIQKARSEICQAEYELEDIERDLREKILLACEKLALSFNEVEAMRKGVLNEATETFNLTQTGYQRGKLEYGDVVEAQKMLSEIQEKYLDVVYEYHKERAELSRLSGDFNCICKANP